MHGLRRLLLKHVHLGIGLGGLLRQELGRLLVPLVNGLGAHLCGVLLREHGALVQRVHLLARKVRLLARLLHALAKELVGVGGLQQDLV